MQERVTSLWARELVVIQARMCQSGVAKVLKVMGQHLAANTQETGSGVYIYYIFIYLCVILHGNDSMRMLRHHVVDLNVTGKGRHQRRSKVKSVESWQCSSQCGGSSSRALGGYKSASWSVLLGNFRPYSSRVVARVVAMAVAVIHG